MTSCLSLALRQSSRDEQSLRLYVYPVSVRDFGIDPQAIEKYERWLDMSTVPVPHNITGMETDIEHNHVLHNPDVGLAAVAQKVGVRVWKPEDANAFWLPISNVMLCASTWERGKQHYPIISKVAYTCDAYVSILQWLFKQESWKRNGGADHVFDIDQVPMGFGGLWTPQHQDDNATHRMLDRALANSIIISIEDRSADAIQRIKARKEIIVPYFVDRNKYWVRPSQHKTALVSFVGSAEVECHVENCNTWNSLTIRERVKGELANATDAVLVDLGGDRLPSSFDWSAARDVYSNSLFCIAPAGDSFTSARFFAVLMSTCIPVSINDYAQLPFEDTLPKKWTDFIVNIKEAHLLQNGVLDTLRKLSQDKVLIEEMQGKGRKARWWLSYARSKDAAAGPSAQRMILEEIANRVGARWAGNWLFRQEK
jgi:hypothetical protein